MRVLAGAALVLATGGCSIVAPLDGLSGAHAADAAAAADVAQGSDGPAPDGTVGEGGGDAGPPSEASTESGPGHPGLERSVTVTAGDAVPAGYTVSVAVDTAPLVAAGKLRADLADLRVTDGSGVDLDRVLDVTASAPTVVWFQLDGALAAGASGTYWLRYDDPDAGVAPRDPTKVFAFYDDFGSPPLSSRWVTLGGPVAAAGSVRLRAWNMATSTDPDSLRADPPADGVPAASALEIVAAVTNPASPADSVNGFWYWLGYQRQGDFQATEPWILWIARASGTVQAEWSLDGGAVQGPAIAQDTAADRYRIERAPSRTRFFRNGQESYELVAPNAAPYSIMLRNWMPQSDVVVTLVRAWLLVDVPPTVALGPEQAAP